jgi:hypothetical protein
MSYIWCSVVGPTTHKFGAPPIRALQETGLVLVTKSWRSKLQWISSREGGMEFEIYIMIIVIAELQGFYKGE